MKKLLILTFSINCWFFITQAQDQLLIDSLETVLKATKHDTTKANILYELSKANWYANPDEAIDYANQSLVISERIGSKKGMGFAYYSMGVSNVFKVDYKTAIEFTKKAQRIGEEIRNKQLIASTYVNLGVIYIHQVNYPEAMTNLNAALKIAEEIGDKQIIIWCYYDIANIYTEQGKYSEALKIYFATLKIEEERGNKSGIATSYSSVGIIYNLLGNYPEALKNDFTSLHIQEEIGDKYGTATTYWAIGIIYDNIGNFPEAIKNYSASLKIYEEFENKGGISGLLTNIGESYRQQGNYPEALKYYFASIKIFAELGNKYSSSVSLSNIGLIYLQQGNYPEALKNSFAALKIAEEADQKEVMAYTNVNIGNIYTKIKNYTKASQYLKEGLSFAKAIGSLDVIKQSYSGQSKLDSSRGNFQEALENYKLFITYRDSLVNNENTKKITQQQMQFDFDKKEALLKADHDKKEALSNAEIMRQTLIINSTLGGVGIIGIFSFLLVRSSNRKKKSTFEKQVAQVETKALRSQMNPHFIFNSLNSIDDYIRTNDIKNSSLYINKFSRLMRLILESSRKDEVSLKEDLESLDLYMQLENLRMPKKVECIVNVSPEIDTENLLIPPLLLQPFIENSFKHAFHGIEAPKLEINLMIRDNMLVCTVIDNGIGRHNKQTVLSEIHENRQSLGMTVTRERLDIISKIRSCRAYFAFEDLVDNSQKAMGTKVLLSVPATFAF